MALLRKIAANIQLILVLSIASSTNALAGNTTGPISSIAVGGGGIIYVAISGKSPSCDASNRYVFDTNSASGKAMYSMVLSAYMAGKPMTILGTNICNIQPDSETIANTIIP